MNQRLLQQFLGAGGSGGPPSYPELDAAITAAGPALWWEARKEMGYSDGASVYSVTEWVDGIYSLTNGNASYYPTFKASGINGIPSFEFNGTQCLYRKGGWSFSQPFSYFVVAQHLDLSSTRRMFDGNITVNRVMADKVSTGFWRYYSGSSIYGTSTPDTNAHLFEVAYNGASSYMNVDNTLEASGDSGNRPTDNICMGATYNAVSGIIGYISLLLIFSTPPTGATKEAMISEIATVYGLTL